MRVVCVQPVNAAGKPDDRSMHLLAGREYVVLAVSTARDRGAHLLFDHSDTEIGWWPAHAFTTVSEKIPPGWTARLDTNGRLDLAPPRWHRPGFWEDFVDGDEDAVAAFREDRDRIAATA